MKLNFFAVFAMAVIVSMYSQVSFAEDARVLRDESGNYHIIREQQPEMEITINSNLMLTSDELRRIIDEGEMVPLNTSEVHTWNFWHTHLKITKTTSTFAVLEGNTIQLKYQNPQVYIETKLNLFVYFGIAYIAVMAFAFIHNEAMFRHQTVLIVASGFPLIAQTIFPVPGVNMLFALGALITWAFYISGAKLLKRTANLVSSGLVFTSLVFALSI